MKTLTIIVDSRGAVYPYVTLSQKLNQSGVHSQMYISADITLPPGFSGAIHDTFDTTAASEQHPVFASEQSTIKLLMESRKIIGQWIPGIIKTIQESIDSGDVIPAETTIIANSPTLLYLGYYLHSVGFKQFIVLEPYRMVDWCDVWVQDKAQMVPARMPWVARLLFASHGKSLTRKHHKDVDNSFADIRNAVVAQAHTYSPLLCKDKHLAKGYPYPETDDNPLDTRILEFIEAKKAQGKKIYFLTIGSMQVTQIKKEEMASEFARVVHEMDAAALVQGDLATQFSNDEAILGIHTFISYKQLFPMLDLIFHHCGSGTLHSALYAGKPSFMIPFLPDQYQWSEEAERIGIRVGQVSAKEFKSAEIIRQIKANFNQQIIDHAGRMSEIEQREHNNGLEQLTEFIMHHI